MNKYELLIKEYRRIENNLNGPLKRVKLRELKPRIRRELNLLLLDNTTDWRTPYWKNEYINELRKILKQIKDI